VETRLICAQEPTHRHASGLVQISFYAAIGCFALVSRWTVLPYTAALDGRCGRRIGVFSATPRTTVRSNSSRATQWTMVALTIRRCQACGQSCSYSSRTVSTPWPLPGRAQRVAALPAFPISYRASGRGKDLLSLALGSRCERTEQSARHDDVELPAARVGHELVQVTPPFLAATDAIRIDAM